jgi:hypothetical protein
MLSHTSKLGLYLCVFAGVACKPALSYELQVDTPLPPGEREHILEAVGDWEGNLPELRVEVMPAHGGCAGAPHTCLTIKPLEDAWIEDSKDPNIFYSLRLSNADTAHTIRHRLGHAFGIREHTPHTVMDDDPATWAYVVTPGDVEAFRAR